MALNWNAYLADDALNPSSEAWPDVQTPQTARPPTATSATASATPNAQTAVRLTPESDSVSSYETRTNADSYFSDAYYQTGDYFLSDLEVLQPFGDTLAGNSTSESSPEPLSATDLLGSGIFTSPRTQSSNHQRPHPSARVPSSSAGLSSRSGSISNTLTQRPRTYSGLQNDSMFATKAGFIEDLTFPNGPSGVARTTTSTFDRDAKPAVSVSKEPESTTKRSKQAKADTLSACWTSPLCPNHTKDGPPPDPTTCGGACAPFLFAPADENNPATIVDQSILGREISITDDLTLSAKADASANIARPLKRSESESSTLPSGRVFNQNSDNSPAMHSGGVKRESISQHDDDSTSPDVPADLSETRVTAKPRRRLPHNQVERKYRESLNTQLESLRRVVPSLQPQQPQPSQNGVDIEDLPAPSKPSKAVVLASATAYIKQMEKDKKALADENQMLRTRIKALQALVKCEDCSLMQYVMNLKIQAPS